MCWHIYTEASLIKKTGADNYCSLGGAMCTPLWPKGGGGGNLQSSNARGFPEREGMLKFVLIGA